MAKARQDEQNATNCVGADAALSPLHLPVAAPAGRKTAGFFSIPFKHWEKLPVELQQIFLPLLPPHLERLQRGEIAKTQVLVPQVGVLTLQLKNNEVWLTFADALQWAYQLLHHLAFLPLPCAIAPLAVAPKADFGFGYPNNLFFHPIAA